MPGRWHRHYTILRACKCDPPQQSIKLHVLLFYIEIRLWYVLAGHVLAGIWSTLFSDGAGVAFRRCCSPKLSSIHCPAVSVTPTIFFLLILPLVNRIKLWFVIRFSEILNQFMKYDIKIKIKPYFMYH